MLPDCADVVVIGGGVIGASCAYYLAKHKIKVVLLEKRDLASGSSGACGGTIFLQTKSPGPNLKLALAGAERFRHLHEELAADIEYRNHGGMIIIETETEYDAMVRWAERQQGAGLDVALLDANQARGLETALSPEILGATFSPADAQVNPWHLTFAFIKSAQRHGAKVYTGVRVTGIQTKSQRIELVETDQGRISTGTVVNAAGAYAARIGALCDLDIPIKPRRGQLVVVEATHPLISRCMLSAHYIAAKFNPDLARKGGGVSIEPTAHGSFVLGSTREFVGFDSRVTRAAIQHIARNVTSILPVLKGRNIIRVFAGLRPYTPDGLPILGPVAGLDGFVIAAGHEGDGIALAPITGELIADLIANNRTDFPLEAYKLERFDPIRAEDLE
ncbi:MAG: FAD-dependent oxidoreductase [Desulfobacterales bacterium]|nr:FAD-dependent oxidoreductase [Desulfobacterales bacterium]